MVLPNPRATYKALLLDYDALLAYSDDECCYSLSEREIQMLLAFVDYIGWKTRYIATETEIDQDLIDAWSGNLARKLMSGCCPDEDLGRFTDEGVWQTSPDGGVTWVDSPESDPRNTYIQAPPLPGADGDTKRCAAADNVRDMFLQYRDNLMDLLSTGSTIIAIVAGILAFLAVITGASGAAIGISVLLMGLAAQLLTMTPEMVEDQITPEVLEDFKCLVYCRMESSGQITYNNWLGLLQDIAASFSGFPENFFYQTVNAMGYIGISNAGTIGVATADDCTACLCGDECLTTYTNDNLGGGDAHGTFLGEFSGYLRYRSTNGGGTTQQIFLNSLDAEQGCELIDFRVIENPESLAAVYRIGVPNAQVPANLASGWPLLSCNNFLAAQTPTGSDIPFTIEFLFAKCDP